jgi:hypothetical protein
MKKHSLRRSLPALAGLLALMLSGWAAAEPPSRAARLGYISGTVSFSPAGEADWVQAIVNRPLTTGDRLWSDTNSRAELQIGGAALRLGSATSVVVLNLDDRITQVQLSQGTLKVRVRHMAPNQTFEVDTPNLAFTLRRPGEYRIDVNANDDATAVMVQSGEGEVYGDGASYTVNSRQGYRFYGTDLSDYDRLGTRRDDDLDRWASERDRRGDNSPSARYVSSEVVGYEDLDNNGTWRSDREYGNVWTPSHVAADWTPYRDGHWAWVDPWGWTWVDDAPWGFAVSHYGRWTNIRGAWGWVPGPQREQAVYAPALVAFVGSTNSQVSVSVGGSSAPNVGWFPLAPREVYQPSYPVSSTYFANINRSNAVIAPTIITKVYNTTNVTNVTNNTTNINVINNTTNVTNIAYVNQHVAGAVVAVPVQAFVQSQPVAKAVVKVSQETVASAPVVHLVAVAPARQSVHGGAPTASAAPPAHQHAIVARTAPPPPPVPFAVQQKQLAAKPGMPIDEAQRTQLKPAAPPATAPKVSVVAAVKVPTAAALPPETAPAAKSPEARKVEAAKVVEAAKSGAARPETAKGDTGKADAAKAATAKAEASKVDATKAEAARAEAARAEAARAEAAKVDAAKAATAKVEASKADAAKADAAKADAAKAAESRTNAARTKAEQSKAESAKAEQAKAERARAEAAKADAAKAANAKAEESRANAAKAEQAKAEHARAEAAKADAARNANAKAEESRNNAARAAAAKADAAKNANAKAEETRNNTAKAEAARANAAKGAPPQAAPGAPPPAAHAPDRNPNPDAKSEEERKKKKAEEDAQNR